MTLSPTQQLLVSRMSDGAILMWSPSGPELHGFPFWPQRRTVRALITKGVLAWGEPHNPTQDDCGMVPVVLT